MSAILSLFLAQATMQTLDTRPQKAVPATDFRCTFFQAKPGDTKAVQFILDGRIPEAPEGHLPSDSFPVQLRSTSATSLAGKALADPIRSSEWYREYQVSRRVGTTTYLINLMLRRDGRSVAYTTVYDESWNSGVEPKNREPYRYDAAGLCAANFSPEVPKS